MLPASIETDSLVLRPLSPEYVDAFEFYECFRAGREGVGQVFEFVPQEPFESPKVAHEWLEDAAEDFADAESAKYAIFVGAGDTLAGMGGMGLDWERQTASLGVILAPEHWGNGYAGECAIALTEVAFDRLDLEVVSIGFEAGNERSRSAVEGFIERVGGRKDGVLRNRTPLDERIADHHRYTVIRSEYEAATDRTG